MGKTKKRREIRLEKKKSKEKLWVFLYLGLSIIYMEMVLKIVCCSVFSMRSIIYTILFSFVPAFLVEGIFAVLKRKSTRILSGIILFFLWILFSVQLVYQRFFGKFMVLYSITAGGVDQVTGEGMLESAVMAVVTSIPMILLLAVPFVVYCLFGRKRIRSEQQRWYAAVSWFGCSVVTYLLFFFFIKVIPDVNDIYYGPFDADLNICEFGLLNTEVKDFKYNVLGVEQDMKLDMGENVLVNQELPQIELTEPVKTVKRIPNVMDIDFEMLAESESDDNLKMLHEYFAEETPTYTNEYTGMFEGYNLILITAEGFSPYAVDEELTPTLYKMMNEGFQFPNFYTPIWGVSTSDGEYVACTGLIPKSGVWSFYKSGENYMPFCMGNQFEKIGVELRNAYHNHTYDYYHRDVSHPNMGYTYKGLYGGLTTEQISPVWPESDLEMIEATVSDYVQSEKQFVTYYMTVSGHLQYSRTGNSMSYKNWDLVKHLDCSDTLKAYYACNIELDKAMEALLEELNKAGIADKTVIAISPDHYPYGLEDKDSGEKYKYFNEMIGHEVERNFELYKGIFILYNQGMEEPLIVDKYSSSLDIIPTLSNLFGLEYDSRLLMGKDILSDNPALVIFSNRSWITDKGKYNYTTKKFELFEGQSFADEEEQEEYIKQVNKIVSNRFKVSSMILDYDYYNEVVPKN